MTYKYDAIQTLTSTGISYEDAVALRRISMTLSRWHELECGDGNDYASWCLVRGHKKNKLFTYDDNGKPYIERHIHTENKPRYESTPDREKGALKRLNDIMQHYPDYEAYVQGDPRGAALFILRPGDIKPGQTIDESYSNGIAVCK